MITKNRLLNLLGKKNPLKLFLNLENKMGKSQRAVYKGKQIRKKKPRRKKVVRVPMVKRRRKYRGKRRGARRVTKTVTRVNRTKKSSTRRISRRKTRSRRRGGGMRSHGGRRRRDGRRYTGSRLGSQMGGIRDDIKDRPSLATAASTVNISQDNEELPNNYTSLLKRKIPQTIV